jgi:hypothetical protein
MSTTAVSAQPVARRTRRLRRPRLVSAEFLKLRKRRGLVISSLALTVLPMVVAYIVLLSLHAANPAKHGPAGGLHNFTDSLNLLSTLAGVAAILIGATIGAGDLSSGVFRELVITGRSRFALFAARIPAGLALVWFVVGAGFAVTALASNLFAGSLQAPGGDLILKTAAWLALVSALSLVFALGISALIGSRGTTIGVVLGWQLVAMPVLIQIKALGTFRESLIGAATERLAPAGLLQHHTLLSMSTTALAGVVAGWTFVPLALGAWRTVTRDA